MQTYQYIGEAEQVVPFTLDGPRVLEQGDVINVADDDESFKDHPSFAKVAAGFVPAPKVTPEATPEPAPAPVVVETPAPAPAPEPVVVDAPAPAGEPDPLPAPTEPTA